MNLLLLLVSVVVFVLAAFGVTFGGVEIVPLGLAFFAASFLVGPVLALRGPA